jgi:hypothetical protein
MIEHQTFSALPYPNEVFAIINGTVGKQRIARLSANGINRKP